MSRTQETGSGNDKLVDFSYEGSRLDISFTAKSGEILGIAGIAGSGQKELLEAIAGLRPIETGSIIYTPEGKHPEELVGKKIIVVANLKPARIAGVESEGMLLAGTNNACGCKVIFVDPMVPVGTIIK